jgi:hypothetical protein
MLGVRQDSGSSTRPYRMVCFLMLSCLIFRSKVDRGIPSLAADVGRLHFRRSTTSGPTMLLT